MNFDPLLDMAGVVSGGDRIDEWKQRVQRLPWCKQGDDSCEWEASTVEAVRMAKKFGLAANTVVGKDKNGAILVLHYIYRQAAKCHHIGSEMEEIRKRIVVAVHDEGLRTDGAWRVRSDVPNFFYDNERHSWWSADANGNYESMVFEQAVLTLNLAGLDPNPQKDGSPSEVAVYLERCRRENGVDLTGRFAGYDRGLHKLQDWRVLATKGFKLIEPKQDPDGSRCPHIRAIVDGLFGAKQKNFFQAKLKCDIEAHRAGIRSGGLALVVVGPTDIGKTLLLKAIVPLLGGRAADAYDFLAGKTAFNSELMGTEVHYIDDSNPFTDRKARRQFANMIRKAVAAAGVYCHKKGKDGVTLPLYRRVFIFLNHDSMDAMPEMEDSLMDKVMMLQAEKFKMPQGCLLLPSMAEPEKYVNFVKVLEQELPYYLSHLLHLQVRDELKDRRFEVRAFKHPAPA